MHIKEFSAMTGLSQSSIRFYEKRGLLQSPREDNGYRDFSPEDAFRMNAFRKLLSYNFSIDEAINYIDSPQATDAFLTSLASRKDDIEEQIEILRRRVDTITNALGYIEQREGDNVFSLTNAPDCLYIQASVKRDFSVSMKRQETIAEFYGLLGASQCMRIIKSHLVESEARTVIPNYIIGVRQTDAHLLSRNARQHARLLPLGPCVYWRREITRSEGTKGSSYEPLRRYLREHNLKIAGDILTAPQFLNLDGKGTDVENIYVPIEE